MDKIFKRKAVAAVSDDSRSISSSDDAKSATTSAGFSKNKLRKKTVVRKWNEDYIKYGFYLTEEEKTKPMPRPTCMICPKLSLANQAMVPNKLNRHLLKNHPGLQFKQKSYFMTLKQNMQKSAKTMGDLVAPSRNAPLVRASFRIAHLLALHKKPFTEAEDVVGPSLQIAAEELFDKNALSKVREIPLSNDTMTRRVDAIAQDLEDQIMTKIRTSPWYGIQFDESTDFTNRAQLIGFVRFVDLEKEDIFEDFLFCEDVGVDTTGEAISKTVLKILTENQITLSQCSKITTDGAAGMTGIRNGAVAKIKKLAPNCEGTHCDLHRENLASKPLNSGGRGPFDKVMEECVKAINEIKAKGKNSRIFTRLCEEMGETNRTLLYHCDVRWLSRGFALIRLFALRKAVLEFFRGKGNDLANLFSDDSWLAKLGYLADIFSKLNELNRSLQGGDMDIFTATEKIEAFKIKICFWKSNVEKSDVTDFPNLKTALLEAIDTDGHDDHLAETTLSLAKEHLIALSMNFDRYFPSLSAADIQKTKWILNPFLKDNIGGANLTNSELETLIEMHCDSRMRDMFKQCHRTKFWTKAFTEEHYKPLSSKAIKELVSFHSSYLCEQGFSQMIIVKNKKRNRLSGAKVASCLRIALTKTVSPRFDRLQSNIQEQPSH